MSEFFNIVFSLPTAVFTWPLMLVTLYWGLSLTGLFSAEGLHVDGALDGAAEAVTEGLAQVGDALPDGALEAHGGVHESHRWSIGLGFGDVPRSFSWSLMVLFGWIFSLAGSYYVPGFKELATRGLWLALVLAGVSLALATVATAIALKPLRRALEVGLGPERRDLLGRVCTITTQRVDQSFGQAELDDGSSLIQVRNREGADLGRGSQAVIFDYDAEREVFWVAPLDLAP